MSGLSEVRVLDVWRALGGPEPRRGRAPAWWRNTNDSNVSIDAERGLFYDHVQNRDGGILALVATVLNCGRAEALAWLEREGFLEPRTFTKEQRFNYAQRRNKASAAAQGIGYWRGASIVDLNTKKLIALEKGDDGELERAASLCNLLENGSPEDIVREFLRQRADDPSGVARLVAQGEERDREARRITAQAVLFLAQVTPEEVSCNVTR